MTGGSDSSKDYMAGMDILGSPLSSKIAGKISANFPMLPLLSVAEAAAHACTFAQMTAVSVKV